MPFIITASDRSTKLWGNTAKWPIRLDCASIIVSAITLLFSLSSGVFHVGVIYFRWAHVDDHVGSITGDVASRIALEVAVPLFAVFAAITSLWLHCSRTLLPALAVATSVVMLAAWAIMIAVWVPQVQGHHSLVAMRAVRAVKLLGASIEVLLNLTYLVYASLSLHRLRKNGPSNVPSNVYIGGDSASSAQVGQQGVELESRRVSHVSVADFHGGLRPQVFEDGGRRRTSWTPSFEIGKGPKVEPREIF